MRDWVKWDSGTSVATYAARMAVSRAFSCPHGPSSLTPFFLELCRAQIGQDGFCSRTYSPKALELTSQLGWSLHVSIVGCDGA
jgi:hypothetical protein